LFDQEKGQKKRVDRSTRRGGRGFFQDLYGFFWIVSVDKLLWCKRGFKGVKKVERRRGPRSEKNLKPSSLDILFVCILALMFEGAGERGQSVYEKGDKKGR